MLHCQVITPLDWERDYGLTEGSIYHGEMGLDQLLVMRPIPGWSRYQTPIKNLYLCGAGSAPRRRRHRRAGLQCRPRPVEFALHVSLSCTSSGQEPLLRCRERDATRTRRNA